MDGLFSCQPLYSQGFLCFRGFYPGVGVKSGGMMAEILPGLNTTSPALMATASARWPAVWALPMALPPAPAPITRTCPQLHTHSRLPPGAESLIEPGSYTEIDTASEIAQLTPELRVVG